MSHRDTTKHKTAISPHQRSFGLHSVSKKTDSGEQFDSQTHFQKLQTKQNKQTNNFSTQRTSELIFLWNVRHGILLTYNFLYMWESSVRLNLKLSVNYIFPLLKA